MSRSLQRCTWHDSRVLQLLKFDATFMLAAVLRLEGKAASPFKEGAHIVNVSLSEAEVRPNPDGAQEGIL